MGEPAWGKGDGISACSDRRYMHSKSSVYTDMFCTNLHIRLSDMRRSVWVSGQV